MTETLTFHDPPRSLVTEYTSNQLVSLAFCHIPSLNFSKEKSARPYVAEPRQSNLCAEQNLPTLWLSRRAGIPLNTTIVESGEDLTGIPHGDAVGVILLTATLGIWVNANAETDTSSAHLGSLADDGNKARKGSVTQDPGVTENRNGGAK
jgi:hypothetical protein